MSKMFSGIRPLKEIEDACHANGWSFDHSRYDKGSDYVTFEFHSEGKRFVVIFSSFNGRFIVKQGKKLITEESTEMDGIKWYDDLLDFIYLQKTKKAKKAA